MEVGLSFLPHEMMHAMQQQQHPAVLRSAPHEFYDGSSVAIVITPGGHRFLFPHQQMHETMQQQHGAPVTTTTTTTTIRPFNYAPHEFYDGTAPVVDSLEIEEEEEEEEEWVHVNSFEVCQEGYELAGDATSCTSGCILCSLCIGRLCPVCRFTQPTETEGEMERV